MLAIPVGIHENAAAAVAAAGDVRKFLTSQVFQISGHVRRAHYKMI